MIRVICPGCGSKLDAKDHLEGQTRNCPRCHQPVLIRRAEPAMAPEAAAQTSPPDAPPPAEAPAGDLGLPRHEALERLDRHSRYAICDRTKVIAAWENDGKGWRLKTDGGFVSAARNQDKLPAEGDFRLVELKLDVPGERPRLVGLASYQLARRWALNALPRGDDNVLQSITGPVGLNRDQKYAVRRFLGENLMREIWGDAGQILDYLGNADFHSHRVQE